VGKVSSPDQDPRNQVLRPPDQGSFPVRNDEKTSHRSFIASVLRSPNSEGNVK